MPYYAKTSQKKFLDQGQHYKIRLHNFYPNWVQIVQFASKRDILAKLAVTIVYLLLYTFMLQNLKKIHKEQIIRQKVPDWAHIAPKGVFWKNGYG